MVVVGSFEAAKAEAVTDACNGKVYSAEKRYYIYRVGWGIGFGHPEDGGLRYVSAEQMGRGVAYFGSHADAADQIARLSAFGGDGWKGRYKVASSTAYRQVWPENGPEWEEEN